MELNRSLVKRFSRLAGLPLPSYNPEYLEYYLKLYNDSKFIERYDKFMNALEYYGIDCSAPEAAEQVMRSEMHTINDELLASIKERDGFLKLQADDLSKYRFSCNLPTRDVYKVNNVDKIFLSIDLKQGCFQTLNRYDEAILHAKTFEEFIDLNLLNEPMVVRDFLKSSKQYRQSLLGKLEPRKSEVIMKYYTYKLYCYIIEELQIRGISNVLPCSLMKDEIVFKLPKDIDYGLISGIIQTIACRYDFFVHINIYKLLMIHDSKKYFLLKSIIGGKPKLACVPRSVMPQVIKHLRHLPIKDTDLVYESNGEDTKMIPIYRLDVTCNKFIDR